MVQNEGDRLTRVVVCTPRREYLRAAPGAVHNILESSDPLLAAVQHDRLKRLISAAGCEVVDVPELSGHPNSVFTRDTALCTPRGFIRMRMGLATRRGEEEWMSRALADLGLRCAGEICAPATAEGGDVILAGGIAFIGQSRRTSREGAAQLADLLREIGFGIRCTQVSRDHLHLGGGMSLVGPRRVLCCRGEFPRDFFSGLDVIEVAHLESAAGNVICLSDSEVIADSSGGDGTIRALERSGIRVHAIDMSEFRKGAGGPTCLILPVDRESADS